MNREKLHDPACYDLARGFLGDLASERLASELAQHIQDTVEDWIAGEAERIKAELERPRQ